MLSFVKTLLKRAGIIKPYEYRELQRKIKDADCLFLHSVTKNIGDLICCPIDYFDDFYQSGLRLSTHELTAFIDNLGKPALAQLLRGKTVVFGGGGLIALERHRRHQDVLEALAIFAEQGGKVVIWGAGHNRLSDYRAWFEQHQPNFYPDYFARFSVGIRDVGSAYRWVPCVSCMHPVFDKSYQEEHKLVVFLHGKESAQLQPLFAGLPTHTNISADYASQLDSAFAEIIAFLASGETVITNSYHGVYWATLLGKKVIAIPNSSKFLSLRYPVGMIENPSDLQSILEVETRAYPNALSECRKANSDFCETVKAEFAH